MMAKRLLVLVIFILFSVRPAWALPEFLNKFFPKKEEKTAQESSPPAAQESENNIEELLATLEETLAENRKLRTQISELEAELQKAPREANLLKSQIRGLQRQVQDLTEASRRERTAWEEERSSLQETIRKTEKQLRDSEETLQAMRAKINSLQAENQKYAKLLEEAVFEEERGQYRNLFQSAERAAERAAEELAEKTVAYERMRRELGETHYALGNLLFEMGRKKEAAVQYQKAVALNPDDSWAHHNLGILYDYYFQDKEAALYHYGKYLKLKPVLEEADKIHERVLELKLKSLVIPPEPLREDFRQYTRETELRETRFQTHT